MEDRVILVLLLCISSSLVVNAAITGSCILLCAIGNSSCFKTHFYLVLQKTKMRNGRIYGGMKKQSGVKR